VKVSVIGPNGVNDATFHVHADGCRDISRYGRIERPWSFDADSIQYATEVMFSDFIGTEETFHDNRYTTWEDYVHEIRFFPCVTLK
jgi:hypothetical protein